LELRQYWSIIRRRWWLPVGCTLAALIVATIVGVSGAAAYKTDMRVAISTIPTPDPTATLYYDPTYYSNLDSEYLADDMTEFIASRAFANEVSRELAASKLANLDVGAVVNATRAKKTHRFIDVTVTTSSFEDGNAIANSISRILSDKARLAQYLQALSAYNTQMTVVTPPSTHRANTPLGLVNEIALRTLIGLIVGVRLALLFIYLDPHLRSRDEVADVLGVPIVGEIPRSRSGVAA